MKNKKGFTLIEMAVVLLVIGILSGILLRNIGELPKSARDQRRIGDLKSTEIYLATYLNKFGYFPSSTSWSALETELRNVGIVDRLPRDPSGKEYNYYPCTDTGSLSDYRDINHFILRAQLEQTASSAPRIWETSLTSTPLGWTCNGTPNCNPAQRYYCMAK